MQIMIKVSVAGASGYSGAELVRLLLRHPEVEIVHLAAGTQSGKSLAEVFPSFEGLVETTLVETDWKRLGQDSDVVFLALPHGLGLEAAPVLLKEGAKIIDVGADYRLKDPEEYQQWYGLEHTQTSLLEQAVYGLPELNREQIKKAQLIANPGCYPTASVLALLPVLEHLGEVADLSSIIVDAKSGTSGAGRAPGVGTLYCEVNENVKPYKVASHRHGPEMEQALAAAGGRPNIFFTPHLIPMTRGILAACYVKTKPGLSQSDQRDLRGAFETRYASEAFVRVLREPPQTKATYGSNFCDVAVHYDERSGVVCAFGAIDNLMKGAAGQAVQNMNLMSGLKESLGLELVPLFP